MEAGTVLSMLRPLVSRLEQVVLRSRHIPKLTFVPPILCGFPQELLPLRTTLLLSPHVPSPHGLPLTGPRLHLPGPPTILDGTGRNVTLLTPHRNVEPDVPSPIPSAALLIMARFDNRVAPELSVLRSLLQFRTLLKTEVLIRLPVVPVVND